eukprot:10965308-Alexandrium_andersonii.AAC.1
MCIRDSSRAWVAELSSLACGAPELGARSSRTRIAGPPSLASDAPELRIAELPSLGCGAP